MNQRRKNVWSRRLPLWVVLVAVGFALGYWVRDRRHDKPIRAGIEAAEKDMKTGIRKAKKASEELGEGAKKAADTLIHD